MTIIPFGEFAPDAADFGNSATVANGVVPKDVGTFGPLPVLSEFSSALPARCQGGYAGKDDANNTAVFMGTAAKLIKLNAAGYDDVSRTAGYSTATDGAWEFTQYGNRVIASNFVDPLQSFVIGTSSLFQDLTTSTSAPTARHIAMIDPGFLMVGNTNDANDGAVPNRVWWSEYLVPTSWPAPGTATAEAAQSDFNDLPNGGWVQRVIGAIGGAAGAVFMENAVYRMDYAGPPTVFNFVEVERNRGTPIPGSVSNVGPFAIYVSDNGFYKFNGAQSVGVGAGKVDKYFWADVDQSYLDRVSSAIDPLNKLYICSYPGDGNTSGGPNKFLILNYETNQWATGDQAVDILFRLATAGYTMEDLDALGYNLDTLPFSLDSRAWTGGQILLGGVSSNHKLGFLNGANAAATLETGEVPDAEMVKYFDGIRPIVDGGTVTAAVGYRNSPSGTVNYTTATSAGDDGVCPQRISARYGRAKVSIAAGGSWTHAIGIEPRFIPNGRR